MIYPRFNSRHRGLSVSTHSYLAGHSLVEVKPPNPGFTTEKKLDSRRIVLFRLHWAKYEKFIG